MMKDLARTIAMLEARQSDLDHRIGELDARLAEALERQAWARSPDQKAPDTAVREAFVAMGDLLYELGKTTARLEDALRSAGELRRLPFEHGAPRWRKRL